MSIANFIRQNWAHILNVYMRLLFIVPLKYVDFMNVRALYYTVWIALI
uniref:Bestrophin homolog n=1 Tax=Ascaris lumbricoides TaxID=6252 RepID=A0A0M3I9L6_ASCLU